jgi:hypothetical protein
MSATNKIPEMAIDELAARRILLEGEERWSKCLWRAVLAVLATDNSKTVKDAKDAMTAVLAEYERESRERARELSAPKG